MKRIEFHKPFIAGKESVYMKEVFKRGHFYGAGHFTYLATEKIKSIIGSKYVLLTDSCTSALEIASLCLEKKDKKSEIIMPSYTFSSTANSFAKHGFKLKFVDIDPSDLMIDVQKLRKSISKSTLAIVAVHYGSHLAKLDEIKNICEDENLIFIEDAAQAFGSKFKDKYAGTYGNYGCFSFHETKNIHCGMGGAFVTDNELMYEKAMIIWERGTDRQKKLRGLVDKYTWREIGGSYYPSEFQAAFLLAQLEQYEKNFLKRKMLYEMYEERIDPISKKFNFFYRKISKETSSNYHSFYIILKSEKDCEGLISYLEKSNIYAFIGYTPLHTSPVGKKAFPSNLPVTDDISNRVLRLPFHNYLTKRDILLVVNKIKDYFEGI